MTKPAYFHLAVALGDEGVGECSDFLREVATRIDSGQMNKLIIKGGQIVGSFATVDEDGMHVREID